MGKGLLLLAGLTLLAGCSMEIPSFVGREGGGDTFYRIGGAKPQPEPRPVALRQALAEPSLHGIILRATGEAPAQGYHTAQLRPLNGGAPDAAGILGFEFVAIPPETVVTVGPAQTRVVTAAVFFPTLALKNLRGFRVAGGGNVTTLPIR